MKLFLFNSGLPPKCSIRFDNWLLDANHVKFGLWEFVGKFKNVAEINLHGDDQITFLL